MLVTGKVDWSFVILSPKKFRNEVASDDVDDNVGRV